MIYILFIFITQHCPVYDTSFDVCYMLILQDGLTPLMLAAWQGHLEVVTFLVTHGSQLEATTKVMIDFNKKLKRTSLLSDNVNSTDLM